MAHYGPHIAPPVSIDADEHLLVSSDHACLLPDRAQTKLLETMLLLVRHQHNIEAVAVFKIAG
jgi:hypothetical protein